MNTLIGPYMARAIARLTLAIPLLLALAWFIGQSAQPALADSTDPDWSDPRIVWDMTAVAGSTPDVACPAGYNKVPQDLNQGAGGDFVYICLSRNKGSQTQPLIDVYTTDSLASSLTSTATRIGVDLNAGNSQSDGSGSGDPIYPVFDRGLGDPIVDVNFITGDSESDFAPDLLAGSVEDNEACARHFGAGWESWDYPSEDLNGNAGGKYIFGCVQVNPARRQAPNAIWDLQAVAANTSSVACPSGYTRNDTDLNHGAGGQFIYLCTTRANLNHATSPLGHVFVMDVGGFGDGSCWNATTDPVDLNAGAGGDYLHFCTRRSGSTTDVTDIQFFEVISPDGRTTASIDATCSATFGSQYTAILNAPSGPANFNLNTGDDRIYGCQKLEPAYGPSSTPIPENVTPTISSGVSCIAPGYAGSRVTISWPTQSPVITFVDISTDPSFSTYFNSQSYFGVLQMPAPLGFFDSSGAPLTLDPNVTYYVRTYNGVAHSATASFSIPACLSAPTVTTSVSCISAGYAGSGVSIAWPARTPSILNVDISTDPAFGSYFNQAVSGVTSITAPAGFQGYAGVTGPLTLDPGVTYYARTFDGSLHSDATSFSLVACPPPMPSIAAGVSCIPTAYTGSGVTISWPAAARAILNVDISTDPAFGSNFNAPVAGATSISAPAGFQGYAGVAGPLALDPGVTYYVRTFDGSLHSDAAAFSIPACDPAGPPTPPGATPELGSLLLMGVGLLGIGGATHRRWRRTGQR